MDVPVGFTPIDSYYEIQGFRFAQGVYERFFPFFSVFLIGCALVYFLMKKDRSLKDLVVYLFYLAFAFFLLQPTDSKIALPEYASSPQEFQRHFEDFGNHAATVRAPRAMLYMHYLSDAIVRGTLKESNINIRNSSAPERLQTLLRRARIQNTALADRYRTFLVGCYVPAFGRAAGRKLDTSKEETVLGIFTTQTEGVDRPDLNPFNYGQEFYKDLLAFDLDGDPTSTPCWDERLALRNMLMHHIHPQGGVRGAYYEHELHEETVKEMTALQNRYAMKGRTNWRITVDHHQFLFNVMVTNESRAFFKVAGGEIKQLEAAVPEYNMFKTGQQSISGVENFWQWAKSTVSFVIRARQSIDQWFSHHAEVPAMYYKVSNYAPYVYGLSMMILVGIFPFAAAVTVLPWGWKSLVKWGKFLLMVKLWVLIWGMLADFNEARYQWNDEFAEQGLASDGSYIFGGIAVMYILTPTIAGIVVQLLDHAATSVAGAAMSFMPQGAHASPYFQNASGHILSANPLTMAKNVGHYVTGDVFRGGGGQQGGGGGGGGQSDNNRQAQAAGDDEAAAAAAAL